MKLSAEGLQLDIRVKARTLDSSATEPYDDWLKCEARITVPSFSGAVRWQALAADFRRFRDELLAMDEAVGTPVVATLAGPEPGVRLKLHMQPNGQILGEYEFSDYDGIGADAPVLAGDFGLDQSYLKSLIRDVDAVLCTEQEHTPE